jgi:N-methylhydantoinase A
MLHEVGLGRAIVPRYPGVTSAMGCVIADMRQDFVQTVNRLVDSVDEAELGRLMQSHHDDGMALLDAAKSSFERRDVEIELDMAYVGQTHTVSVPLPVNIEGGRITPPSRAEIAEAFDAAYLKSYGRLLEKGTRRVMNLRSAVIGRRPKFDLSALAPAEGGTVEGALKGHRQVHFGDTWHGTAIYRRLELPVGAVIEGPAILEQPDTTILIEPGLAGTVDRFGNILIEPKEKRP